MAENPDTPVSQDDLNLGDQGTSHPKKRHRVRNVIIVVVVVVVVALAAAFVWAYGAGVITPASAAAKYGTFDYLDEDDITDDIMTYKEMMGYSDATDDDWATFLASYNLTPERLRYSTIVNRISNIAIEQKCKELGITVSDEELDEVIDSYKYAMTFNDEELWDETLEMYGQTEEGFREVQRLELLREKLCTQEVEIPTPSEDEVREYIESFVAERQASAISDAGSEEELSALRNNEGDVLLRHSYCFAYDIAGDEATLDESNQVELIKQEFMESGTSDETFETVLALYSNDDDMKEISGDMGWDADTDEYSEVYLRTLEAMDEPGVSDVFTDGDTICFIWVDQVYALPYAQDELESVDLTAMPSSLYEYFSDCEAYALWQDECEVYVSELAADMPVTIYPMPEDVPYNVDMSPYLVTEEDEEGNSSDSDDNSDSAGNVGAGSTTADTANGESADTADTDEADKG